MIATTSRFCHVLWLVRTGFIYSNCHIRATLKDTKIHAATTADPYLFSVIWLWLVRMYLLVSILSCRSMLGGMFHLDSTPVCAIPLRSLQKNILQAYTFPYVHQYADRSSFNLHPLVYIHSLDSCRYATGLKMSITRMLWLWSWLSWCFSIYETEVQDMYFNTDGCIITWPTVGGLEPATPVQFSGLSCRKVPPPN